MDETVSQRGLAVIDVRNDRKIANVAEVCHAGGRGPCIQVKTEPPGSGLPVVFQVVSKWRFNPP
jgi:hypothetical protein